MTNSGTFRKATACALLSTLVIAACGESAPKASSTLTSPISLDSQERSYFISHQQPIVVSRDSTISFVSPTTSVVSTTQVTRRKNVPTSLVEPRHVTTTVQREPDTTTSVVRQGSETGLASYYDWHDGECAHKSLPKGTVVRVRRLDRAAETTCRVTDRGPYISGRIIDLDRRVFSRIAQTSAGVVGVEITW
jgi:rare lipoprotein A (peptidoglycan hydrolase)